MDLMTKANIFFGAFFFILALLALHVTFLAFTDQLDKSDRE